MQVFDWPKASRSLGIQVSGVVVRVKVFLFLFLFLFFLSSVSISSCSFGCYRRILAFLPLPCLASVCRLVFPDNVTIINSPMLRWSCKFHFLLIHVDQFSLIFSFSRLKEGAGNLLCFFFSSKTNQSLFSLVQDFNLLAALHEGMGFANSICRLP